jgi:plastocyanin
MKRVLIFTIGLMLLVGSFLFLGCSKSDSALSESVKGSIHANASTINYTTKVTIQNSTFSPASVTVMQSGSILWVNNDQQAHTVTADDGSFDSGDVQPGAAFGWTFNTVGPHSYHCKYHSKMTGLVKCVTK